MVCYYSQAVAMQHLENGLRGTGDPRDLKRADIIAAMLKDRGRDIPLPSAAIPVDASQTAQVQKETVPVEIKRFSEEQREALEKQGFVIYALTGQSIKTLREAGRKFCLTWRNKHPDFEALGSMQSEVAINPSKLFLPKSNNKALAQQENMAEKFSQELGKTVKGVKAIIGQAPDYLELAFAHLDSTKEYLFGAKDKYDYVRTKTPTSSSYVAVVHLFDADSGLDVSYWFRDNGLVNLYAASLVVPV